MPPPVPPPDAAGVDASPGFDVSAFLDGLAQELGVKPAKAFEGTPPENDFTTAPGPAKRVGINPRLVLGAGLLVAAVVVAR